MILPSLHQTIPIEKKSDSKNHPVKKKSCIGVPIQDQQKELELLYR